MKNKTPNLIWLFFLFFLNTQIKAQDFGTLPDYKPITPNAASLFKTFEKPIGTYTGIPPVTVPLHSCNYKGFNLSVVANYNAGGIKVEEFSSSIGLGWNLSIGGMITRVIKGNMDEMNNNGYLYNSIKPSNFTPTNLYLYSIGAFDTSPDLFMISVNGITAKFAFNDSSKIYILDKSEDIIVKPQSLPGFTGFIVTDSKGFVYYFGTNKSGTTNAIDEAFLSPTPNRSAWHLLEVYDMNGVLIAKFDYNKVESNRSATAVSSIVTELRNGGVSGCDPNDYSPTEMQTSERCYENIISKVSIGPQMLIFNQGGRIEGYSAQVNSIEIKDTANVLRKKFNFNYGYFGNTGSPNTVRLKLKNISVQPATGTDSLTYTFAYEESVNLPDRFSKSTDYWGYYNGQSNTSRIPNGIYTWDQTVAIDGYADRRANPAFSKANILKRITYPSGGYRDFEYEGNEALYRNNLFRLDQITPDADDHIRRSMDTNRFVNSPTLPEYTRIFTVNSDRGYSVFHYTLVGMAINSSVKIFRAGTPILIASFINDFSDYYLLPNGNYRVEIDFDYASSNVFLLKCWYDELRFTTTTVNRLGSDYRKQSQNVGGVRIKTIDDYDPVTNKHQYTRFKYYLPNDTTCTSGLLVSYPQILYASSCPTKACGLIRVGCQSAFPLNSDGGAYVVYTNVRIIEDNNGFTDINYSFERDFGWLNLFLDVPRLPPISNANSRGLELSRKYYDSAGNLLQLDTTEYSLNLGETPPLFTCESLSLIIHDYVSQSYCLDRQYFGGYPIYLPRKTTSIAYSSAGSLETKTEFSYFNESIRKLGINQSQTTMSDGKIKIVNNRYAYNANSDFKLPLSTAEKIMKDTLMSKNMLQPMEVTSYLKSGTDSTFLDGMKTSYSIFNGTQRFPSSLKKYFNLADSSTVLFSNYDIYGNVREQYKDNDVKTVFLWGYNNKYMVAAVTGSDYNTVSGFVSNAILQNPSSESVLRTELQKIRTGLAASGAQIISYTYLPAVGVSSITDPAGKTSYYEYDNHFRLKYIKDQDGVIIKKITYNYNTSQ